MGVFQPRFWDPLKAEFSAKQCGNERVSPSLNDATPTTEEGSPATKPRAIPFRLAGVRRVEGRWLVPQAVVVACVMAKGRGGSGS
ncbi:hypothetical protein V6Z11_A12G202100 [Gossypium hirsutum]